MSKPKKIIDNPTSAKILKQLEAFESLEALYKAFPFARKALPKAEDIFSELKNMKEQAEILKLPDQFNERFTSLGWVAYESMNMEVMQKAISIHDTEGKNTAENFLSDSYDEETLKWGILRFNGNRDFRTRIRLTELARDDYLAGRYHACTPLLLSLLDGLVNDVSKHVGFFAENADLTAWDCIAAHESGLQALASILTKGRNRTNEDPITIPYRNGILHGRELAFDNKIVAAKCWSALFAARDWAGAIDDGKKEPRPKEEASWGQLFRKVSETNRMKKLIEEWTPRVSEDIPYLPFEGDVSNLPENTPEHAVAVFLDHWCNKRFGPIADALLYFTDTPKGKKAGMARQDFGGHVPISFKVLSVDDQTSAITHVITELRFEVDGLEKIKEVSVRAIYQDLENNLSARSMPGGQWRIVQNSFSDIIYAPRL
ncbi:hypothetical protein [Permianibacter aggregans]|uniref:Uncharacterized protein n=1 Tax=Permianibacter aggregans TaxID=1510150 RepID=A0A4R6UDI4_9GAMM|nr:hypothetical protein [Permianibacter aggregans]QGX38216.1 hypothetical protein E2H98_00435 [Permianibacter aggregans]TDQ44132.1 hypothetical protein EV696_12614 [Permianibacter aggregans]